MLQKLDKDVDWVHVAANLVQLQAIIEALQGGVFLKNLKDCWLSRSIVNVSCHCQVSPKGTVTAWRSNSCH